MATKNIVPRTSGEGKLGISTKRWDSLTVNSVSASNITASGNLIVGGNATINGNLTFGNADTDNIAFGAEVSSSIIPNNPDKFNLGSSAKAFNEVYVNDVYITGSTPNLYANGTQRLSLGVKNIFSGSISGSGTLDITGNANIDGDLDVDGTANLDVVDIDGAVDMSTTLTVGGVVDITDTTDSSDFSGDTGALRTEGGASIAKKLYVGTDLDVDGTANLDVTDIDGTLNVAGVATAQVSANINQVAITSSSNATAWDAAAAANAYYVTSENTTISAPSNAVEGAIISVEIAQGGTPRTVAWNTVFEFAASTAPTVTATASKTDIFAFRYNGSVWQEIGRSQNMAQT